MNKQEVIWNLVNAGIAGGIFFAGSFSANQQITLNGVMFAVIISFGVALTQFKEYWLRVNPNMMNKKQAFQFI